MGLLRIHLNKNEKITAEAGAMVFIQGDIKTETKMRQGGFLKSLKVSILGSESFFVNDFISHEDNSVLGLTGAYLGDIEYIPISSDKGYIVQSSAFVASSAGINLDTKWQGFKKGIFGSNLFMLKANGEGDLFVNVYGAIISHDLKEGEKIIIDNYQLVALSDDAKYDVRKHGGYKTAIFGGEALVIEITGPGKVYYQTKNFRDWIKLIQKHLPTNQGGSGRYS
jgi:uncharacterized protein (TIGR00266 family)